MLHCCLKPIVGIAVSAAIAHTSILSACVIGIVGYVCTAVSPVTQVHLTLT